MGLWVDRVQSNDFTISGTKPQRIVSCLEALDAFLNQPEPVVSSIVLAEKLVAAASSNDSADLCQAVARILGRLDASFTTYM